MTLPALAATVPPAYASLYEETEDQWDDKDNEAQWNEEDTEEAVREHNQSFNANLYEVVTDDIESDNVEEEEVEVEDEDTAYHNRLDELQKKYGSKQISEVDVEDFRFSATHEHPSNHLHGQGKMEDPLIMLMKVNNDFEDMEVLFSQCYLG